MQTTQEITSSLKNLRYYSSQIAELAKQQFKLDHDRGLELGINAGPGSIRFDCLGAIVSACGWIETFCQNINSNLNTAIAQDKVLHIEGDIENADNS